jgi:hypothetical protein
MKVTLAYINSISSVWGFMAWYWTCFYLGKPRNTCLYYILEPVMALLRLAVLGALLYFVAWKQTLPMFKDLYYLQSNNWWKDYDKEGFFTNDSIINAFFCWVIWLFYWIVVVYLCIAILALCVIVPILKRSNPCPSCRKVARTIRDIFGGLWEALRCYTWCLRRWQLSYKWPSKCANCGSTFAPDEKIGYCNHYSKESHVWMKR